MSATNLTGTTGNIVPVVYAMLLERAVNSGRFVAPRCYSKVVLENGGDTANFPIDDNIEGSYLEIANARVAGNRRFDGDTYVPGNITITTEDLYRVGVYNVLQDLVQSHVDWRPEQLRGMIDDLALLTSQKAIFAIQAGAVATTGSLILLRNTTNSVTIATGNAPASSVGAYNIGVAIDALITSFESNLFPPEETVLFLRVREFDIFTQFLQISGTNRKRDIANTDYGNGGQYNYVTEMFNRNKALYSEGASLMRGFVHRGLNIVTTPELNYIFNTDYSTGTGYDGAVVGSNRFADGRFYSKNSQHGTRDLSNVIGVAVVDGGIAKVVNKVPSLFQDNMNARFLDEAMTSVMLEGVGAKSSRKCGVLILTDAP